MKFSILRQALDGSDLIALVRNGEGQAGVDPPSIDVHRTGATLAMVAALFRARHLEIFAQRIQERNPWLDHQAPLGSIDIEHDRHGARLAGRSSWFFRGLRNRGSRSWFQQGTRCSKNAGGA
jgi:hypothetical protein